MAFKEYGQAVIFIENVLILDTQSIQFGNEQNDSEIFNLVEGFSGISEGTEIFRASVESAVPRAGMPIRLDKKASDREAVNVEIYIGDKSLSTKGYVKNVKFSGSVDSPSSVSFEFFGSPAVLS